jgi:hypothetical protein
MLPDLHVLREEHFLPGRARDRVVMRWMDAIVCVSRAQFDRVRSTLVRERKLVVIRNAIGDEAFAAPERIYRPSQV